MVDVPKSAATTPQRDDGGGLAAKSEADLGSTTSSTPVGESGEAVALLEETLTVSKRRKTKGRVRVTTRTEVTESIAEVELDREKIEVTRVPVGCVVDRAPMERVEGDTTIIPVVEERFVVVKQLFLVEEVRIRHVVERETISERVALRRQRAVVERLDADGNPTDRDGLQPE